MAKILVAVTDLAEADVATIVLPDYIGFHLRLAQLRTFREFFRVFEGTGVTPGVHTVLQIIRDNPGIRQRAIAELLMVREPNMTRLIQSLQVGHLISRAVDKTDRRARHLALTDKGRDLLDNLSQRITALEKKVLGLLDAAQRKTLRACLDQIRANIPY
ncbi:MAG: MarR family winged helix-turn-helix transcriptional regulator [Terriglobia bacterium]